MEEVAAAALEDLVVEAVTVVAGAEEFPAGDVGGGIVVPFPGGGGGGGDPVPLAGVPVQGLISSLKKDRKDTVCLFESLGSCEICLGARGADTVCDRFSFVFTETRKIEGSEEVWTEVVYASKGTVGYGWDLCINDGGSESECRKQQQLHDERIVWER